MSLTRRALAAMGIEQEKIDQIIEMHTATVNGLKDELEVAKEDAKQFKADASKLASVQKELDDLKEKSGKSDPYKQKYDDLKKEYEDFKADLDAKSVEAKKKELYSELLKKEGISEKRIPVILKATNLKEIELDEEGNAIKDVETHKTKIAEEWSDFKEQVEQGGIDTPKPPANNGGNTSGVMSDAVKRVMQSRANMYGTVQQEG